ncbi:MAG: YdbL family protein [Novosphingobium sp.]|uniref:YdbL family protein n=1 Tax=Novosphingobium sp. TaxID=1874826 RepID=UPI0032B9CACA
MINGFNKTGHSPLSQGLGGLMLGAALIAAPLAAQSANPALEAARSSGQVGEQTDGYLGFPGAASAETRRLADDINIKRRTIYVQKAQTNHVTVEEYAISTACQLILKTKLGEKYQAPDGSWKTRTAEAPLRDNRCPPAP